MTDDELREFGRMMTLHGSPPFETVMWSYTAAMRLLEERDKALVEIKELRLQLHEANCAFSDEERECNKVYARCCEISVERDKLMALSTQWPDVTLEQALREAIRARDERVRKSARKAARHGFAVEIEPPIFCRPCVTCGATGHDIRVACCDQCKHSPPGEKT